MEKQILWSIVRICIFVLIILGIVYIGYEVKRIDKTGNICINNPFVYTGKLMNDKNIKIHEEKLNPIQTIRCEIK